MHFPAVEVTCTAGQGKARQLGMSLEVRRRLILDALNESRRCDLEEVEPLHFTSWHDHKIIDNNNATQHSTDREGRMLVPGLVFTTWRLLTTMTICHRYKSYVRSMSSNLPQENMECTTSVTAPKGRLAMSCTPRPCTSLQL